MLTFFQHFLIGKMEEDTQNGDEEVEQEQPEPEHSNETPEPNDETTDESESDETQSQSELDATPDANETLDDSGEISHQEDTPETDAAEEVDIASEGNETQEEEVRTEPEAESEDEEVSGEDQSPDKIETCVTEDITEDPVSSEVEILPETEESTEIEEIPAPEEVAEEVEEPESSEPEIPISIGESEELYDFVAMFEESECTGAEHISANMADSSGGVTKPAILEHPHPTDVSRIVYKIDVPSVEENEDILLYFSIGLRDGVVFDDPERQPGGVKFSIEVLGEQCFEYVSTACQWTPNSLDLTRFAGEKVEIVFITRCNVEGNSNYAWGLWGEPKLLKLSQPGEQQEPSSEIQCGLAIVKLPDDRVTLSDFNRDDLTPVQEVVSEIVQNLDEEPIEIVLYAAQPKLEIVSVGTTAAVVGIGEAFEIQCTIKNVGTGPLLEVSKTRLNINDIKLRRGRTSHNVKSLAPGDTSTFVWYARGVSRPTTLNFGVSLKSRSLKGTEKMEGIVQIRPAAPKLETQVVNELHTYFHGEHVVIGNKNLRLVLVHNGDHFQSTSRRSKKNLPERTEKGYEYYAIYVAKGSTYQQIATSKMIAEVTYLSNGNTHNFHFIPDDVQFGGNSLGESIVRISGEHKDTDGVTWSLQLQFILSEDAKRIKATYNLGVDGERDLLAFRGTEIYAGHKSTREKKTAALFPGLEFLEGDEPSSNTRDAAPPINNRLVPHPYKITIPVMAVEMQKSVIGIAWDPLKSWDGEAQHVSAVYASPNWHDQQRNHLMGLFLPTVPNWVNENSLVAENAYQLLSARPISLECEIIVDGNASILEAISHWTSVYGMPEALDPPRNDLEEIELSRHGFMHTVWDEEFRQSRHCVDWGSQNEPSFATLLWYDYLVTQNEDVKQRVIEIAEKTIADSDAGSLACPWFLPHSKWRVSVLLWTLRCSIRIL